MRRQPGGGAPGDVLDQRRVSDDQTLPRPPITVGLVAPPQIAQLDRFDVGLQDLSPLLRPEGGCANMRF
jgi:hypothetical protein